MDRRVAELLLCGCLLPALVACGGAGPPAGDEAGAAARAHDPRAAQSPYLTEAKALGEYTDRHGFRRKYILVAPGLNDAQLADLGRRLHSFEKDAWLWLLDDAAQARRMLDALPASERGDLSGYPGKWVEAHTVAHSVVEVVPGGGRRWALYKGPYTKAVLVVMRE